VAKSLGIKQAERMANAAVILADFSYEKCIGLVKLACYGKRLLGG
jgi:hypothetical protein